VLLADDSMPQLFPELAPRRPDAVFLFRRKLHPGRTWVISLPPGRVFPDGPPDGWNTDADLENVPVKDVLSQSIGYPGLSASTYAYEKRFVQRNLYRIWLQ
jgi:hypothetical protein